MFHILFWVNGILITKRPCHLGYYIYYINSIYSLLLIKCYILISLLLFLLYLGAENSSSVIPWAIVGVAMVIIIALIVAIVVMVMNQKRQIDLLKQQLRGRQPATGGQDQGSDVHLDEIHLKPERSVQGRDLPASPPQTQSHDKAIYEEVGTDVVAPPGSSHTDGGAGLYDGLVSARFGDECWHNPYRT